MNHYAFNHQLADTLHRGQSALCCKHRAGPAQVAARQAPAAAQAGRQDGPSAPAQDGAAPAHTCHHQRSQTVQELIQVRVRVRAGATGTGTGTDRIPSTYVLKFRGARFFVETA